MNTNYNARTINKYKKKRHPNNIFQTGDQIDVADARHTLYQSEGLPCMLCYLSHGADRCTITYLVFYCIPDRRV